MSVEVSITCERYAPPFLFTIRMYAYNLKVIADSSLWWKIAWLFFFDFRDFYKNVSTLQQQCWRVFMLICWLMFLFL